MIQTPPWRRNLMLVIVAGIVLGFVVSRLFATFAEHPAEHAAWIGGTTVVVLGILVLSLNAAYPPVSYDPVARTVRFGSRTVPIDTVNEAWRTVSAAPQSANVVYRFRSTQGPSARVLVAGRPFRGLDEAGRAALADFVRLAPIRTDDPNAAHRDALASNLLGDSKRVRVSSDYLVRELEASNDPSAAFGDAPATIPPTAMPPDLDAMEADDQAAARVIAALPPGPRVVRRVAGLLLALSVVVAIVLLVIAVVREGSGDRVGDEAVLVVLWILLAFAVTGAARTIAADLDVRQRRSAAGRWLSEADDQQRGRGLPAPFAAAWLEPAPGHRTLGVVSFTLGVVSMFLTLAGLVLLFGDIDEPPFGVDGSVTVLLVGLACGAIAIWGWVRYRRRRRHDAQWVVEVLGPRVV